MDSEPLLQHTTIHIMILPVLIKKTMSGIDTTTSLVRTEKCYGFWKRVVWYHKVVKWCENKNSNIAVYTLHSPGTKYKPQNVNIWDNCFKQCIRSFLPSFDYRVVTNSQFGNMWLCTYKTIPWWRNTKAIWISSNEKLVKKYSPSQIRKSAQTNQVAERKAKIS